MNESHDPDEWQDGEPHPLALALVKLFVYALYCAAVYGALG